MSLRLGLGMVIDLCVCACDKEGTRVCVCERDKACVCILVVSRFRRVSLYEVDRGNRSMCERGERGRAYVPMSVHVCAREKARERKRERVCVFVHES